MYHQQVSLLARICHLSFFDDIALLKRKGKEKSSLGCSAGGKHGLIKAISETGHATMRALARLYSDKSFALRKNLSHSSLS